MLDNFKNNEQNNQDNRILRDNFKDIEEFMDAQNYGNKNADEAQIQSNRDMRDNFRNIQEFMNGQHYNN